MAGRSWCPRLPLSRGPKRRRKECTFIGSEFLLQALSEWWAKVSADMGMTTAATLAIEAVSGLHDDQMDCHLQTPEALEGIKGCLKPLELNMLAFACVVVGQERGASHFLQRATTLMTFPWPLRTARRQ